MKQSNHQRKLPWRALLMSKRPLVNISHFLLLPEDLSTSSSLLRFSKDECHLETNIDKAVVRCMEDDDLTYFYGHFVLLKFKTERHVQLKLEHYAFLVLLTFSFLQPTILLFTRDKIPQLLLKNMFPIC